MRPVGYLLSILLGLLFSCTSSREGAYIMSVTGKLSPSKLGTSLIHEHITTDFIGAEQVEQPQYEQALAVQTILPHLKTLKERGVSTLVECTPNHIGRDVSLLQVLSEKSSLQIITNTGYYAAVDKKYLPQHVYIEDAETLAARWEKEWEKGIDGTQIRPGFIKLGVGKGPLDEVEEKLLMAGVILSKKSGLPIYVHTGDGAAAQSEFEIITREGLEPERLIWVHAQNGTDAERVALAQKGVWISLDGLSIPRVENYINMIKVLKEEHLLSQVLISHDDGWSVENDEGTIRLKLFGNGNTEPYSAIFKQLIPGLREAGITQSELDQLLIENPRLALTIVAPTPKKVIDTGGFEIEVPANWRYKPLQGIDSFVGRILSKGVELFFDMSEMGYANSLSSAEDDQHIVKIDTIGEYRRKLIWPKIPGKGTTGIYIESLTSTFNFNLAGDDLNLENQRRAIMALRSIKFDGK